VMIGDPSSSRFAETPRPPGGKPVARVDEVTAKSIASFARKAQMMREDVALKGVIAAVSALDVKLDKISATSRFLPRMRFEAAERSR
jgi:hypothetical protein